MKRDFGSDKSKQLIWSLRKKRKLAHQWITVAQYKLYIGFSALLDASSIDES